MEKSKLNDQQLKRRQKLATLKKLASVVFAPYSQEGTLTKVPKLHALYDQYSRSELEEKNLYFQVAGRVMAIRGPFLVIKDNDQSLQLYFNRETHRDLEKMVSLIDLGDIIFARGQLSKSNSGELTLRFQALEILTKALNPLPEKYHGLKDLEERYRKRYLDLIVNQTTKETFLRRSKILTLMRQYFEENHYVEVETPILNSVLAGGEAKPFITHYNALNERFNLRVATELSLKRLLVGGFDRIFEIGRVFRNEGIDTTHNPEFTSIEFYEAYSNVEGMMEHTEKVIRYIAKHLGSLQIEYQGYLIDLEKPFKRVNMAEAVNEKLNIHCQDLTVEELRAIAQENNVETKAFFAKGHYIEALFEELIEKTLIQPTFVCYPPLDVSPLAAKSSKYPGFAERAELYINTKEYANMFTELNDPLDQRERFEKQLEEKKLGNEEAGEIDENFLDALEYAMPPAGGCGIGVDRLVMLLTGHTSIREVLLFPTLKKRHSA